MVVSCYPGAARRTACQQRKDSNLLSRLLNNIFFPFFKLQHEEMKYFVVRFWRFLKERIPQFSKRLLIQTSYAILKGQIKPPYQILREKIRLIEDNAKCRQLKKLT
jgi:hypothetical protein